MSGERSVDGWADPAFAACFDAFRSTLDGGELGAACAVYHHGRPVMDAWGGVARERTGAPWQRDTLVPVFSVTKGVAAICVLMLVEHGLLELDAPVARYWPEFAAHGKGQVTVREALAHRAGVPVLSGEITKADLADPAGMAARLAAEPPLFRPGSAHLYHAITIGWITGELVRRLTGQTLGAFLRDALRAPLDLDLWIGHPIEEADRVAIMEVPAEREGIGFDPASLSGRAVSLNGLYEASFSGLAGAMSDPGLQALELAGANALSDARSLAKLYAAVISPMEGKRLLSDATLSDACAIVSEGRMWGEDAAGPTWGAGLMLPFAWQPMLGAGSFGHDGFGGSIAFAHPPSGIAFAYVRNRMGPPGVIDPLVYHVVAVLEHSVGIEPSKNFVPEHMHAS